MYKKLYSFDFDDTLCFTPDQHEGKKIWEEKTGLTWPYNGWWSKSETLDSEIFYIPKNEWVYQKYIDAITEDNSYIIMATGRIERTQNMRKNIEIILNNHNLSFDEVHLNNLGDTYRFKCKLFESLIKKTKCEEFIMYDDRHEHLVKFAEWAKLQNCNITIIDVKNKRIKKIKNI